MNNPNSSSAFKTILLAAFIAGSLDILAAIIVYVYIMNLNLTATRLLQGIARGVFGMSAFRGGTSMALVGLGVHFLIAFSFTVFYFLIFPFIPLFKNQRIISGLLYGIFVWCVMNLVVLPLLHLANVPTKLRGILIGAAILMFCIGLPISLIVSRYYLSKSKID